MMEVHFLGQEVSNSLLMNSMSSYKSAGRGLRSYFHEQVYRECKVDGFEEYMTVIS